MPSTLTLVLGQHPQSPEASWQQVLPSGHSDDPPGHITDFAMLGKNKEAVHIKRDKQVRKEKKNKTHTHQKNTFHPVQDFIQITRTAHFQGTQSKLDNTSFIIFYFHVTLIKSGSRSPKLALTLTLARVYCSTVSYTSHMRISENARIKVCAKTGNESSVFLPSRFYCHLIQHML